MRLEPLRPLPPSNRAIREQIRQAECRAQSTAPESGTPKVLFPAADVRSHWGSRVRAGKNANAEVEG